MSATKPKINGKIYGSIWTDMKKRAAFSLQFGVYHLIIVTQRQSQSHFSFPQTLLFSLVPQFLFQISLLFTTRPTLWCSSVESLGPKPNFKDTHPTNHDVNNIYNFHHLFNPNSAWNAGHTIIGMCKLHLKGINKNRNDN